MRQQAEQRASDELFASRQGTGKIKGPCVTVLGLLGLYHTVTVEFSGGQLFCFKNGRVNSFI